MSSLRYNDKAVITPESSNSTTAEVGESAIKQDLSIKKHNDSISSNDHVDGDIQKCPCCNNPWSSATGDIFALLCQTCKSDKDSDEGVDDSTKKSTKQQQQKVLLQSGEESNSSNESKGISRDNMDFSVKPYDNFFRYANGGWMDKNPIPAECK